MCSALILDLCHVSVRGSQMMTAVLNCRAHDSANEPSNNPHMSSMGRCFKLGACICMLALCSMHLHAPASGGGGRSAAAAGDRDACDAHEHVVGQAVEDVRLDGRAVLQVAGDAEDEVHRLRQPSQATAAQQRSGSAGRRARLRTRSSRARSSSPSRAEHVKTVPTGALVVPNEVLDPLYSATPHVDSTLKLSQGQCDDLRRDRRQDGEGERPDDGDGPALHYGRQGRAHGHGPAHNALWPQVQVMGDHKNNILVAVGTLSRD